MRAYFVCDAAEGCGCSSVARTLARAQGRDLRHDTAEGLAGVAQ
jgi:hypothetical protein